MFHTSYYAYVKLLSHFLRSFYVTIASLVSQVWFCNFFAIQSAKTFCVMTTQTTLRSLGQKSYVFDILVIVTLMLQLLHNNSIIVKTLYVSLGSDSHS